MCTGSSILSDDRVDRSWSRQTNINGGETATAQVIRRPGHGPNVADLNASKCLLDQGPPSQLRWHHDRCTSDSRRLAATPKSAESGHNRTTPSPRVGGQGSHPVQRIPMTTASDIPE